mgnify:CR=1 FL=1
MAREIKLNNNDNHLSWGNFTRIIKEYSINKTSAMQVEIFCALFNFLLNLSFNLFLSTKAISPNIDDSSSSSIMFCSSSFPALASKLTIFPSLNSNLILLNNILLHLLSLMVFVIVESFPY